MKLFTRKTDDHRATGRGIISTLCLSVALMGLASEVWATSPCDDFGECKVIIEINSSDGDLGFHWLVDADDLNSIRIDDPDGAKVFENKVYGPLSDQKMTETFGESSEPVCKQELAEEADDDVVTVQEFVERWVSGVYAITGSSDGGEKLSGETLLSHYLPAAPELFSYVAGTLTWVAGNTLGECADEDELDDLVAQGVLPIHPQLVPLVAWEVVVEVEDSGVKFTARLPVDQLSVTLPAEFLAAFPANTPAKGEVGAIGGDVDNGDDDNATFTEFELCLNEVGDGCAEEEDEG